MRIGADANPLPLGDESPEDRVVGPSAALPHVAASATSGCPDADEIAAYVVSALPPSAATGVEAHLDACPTCARLVGEAAGVPEIDPTTSAHGAAASSPALESTELSPGTTIGRYILLARVGTGGMGEVWVAHDRELDRKAALKVLKSTPELSASAWDRLQTRLQREARAMARLNHPNVVAVHDIGEWHGRVFIAMDYIEGSTLRAWLAERVRSWQEIRDMFVVIARALAAAHEVGLVHRDFKPSNVLVDRTGRPFVADFGLATPPQYDQGGEIAGTPAYMAPEQSAGGLVDARADQFSCCVALFEALHGHRPGSEPGSPRAVRPRVPAWLDVVLARGLARDPADRFPDLHALVDALQHDRVIARRRRIVAIAAIAATVMGGSAWWLDARRPTELQLAHVDALTSSARIEAGAGRFIYPSPNDPDEPTAYIHVMQLEGLDGAAAEIGRARAQELRHEFAEHLVARADAIWSEPGGDLLAVDLYAAALVFDPNDPNARQRAGLTPGQVAGLGARAAELSFTASELDAAQDFSALARSEEPGLPTARPMRRSPPVARRIAAHDPAVPQHAATDPTLSVAPVITESAPPVTVPAVDHEPDARKVASAPDATSELQAGFAALRGADLAVAEARFRRVLKDSPRNHRAVAGLGEVEFERGAYAKSVAQLELAVSLAPKRADYRVLFGDALLKVQRWHDARRQYERGAELGSSVARKRVQQLDASVTAPR